MFVAERFISGLVQIYGERPESTDGGTRYPQACRFLRIKHHIHSPLEKSMMERTMQCIMDRTESFDDHFPCRKKRCKLRHVKNWMLFLQTIVIMSWYPLNEEPIKHNVLFDLDFKLILSCHQDLLIVTFLLPISVGY